MKFHVNKNETVPVKFAKFHAGYGAGEIAAFPEDYAKAVVKAKAAVFVGLDGKPIAQDQDEAAAPAKVDNPTNEPPKPEEVDIPENWKDLHHFQRMALAAKIKGEPIATAELADATISEEIARRAAA